MNPRPLGYEHCDARLWHLGRSLVTALASGNPIRYLVPEPPSLAVSLYPAASGLQIGLQRRFLTCDFVSLQQAWALET